MSNPSTKKSILSLIPGRKLFLRLDNWLRINYPIVWRTKVLYFFLFSFLILNPVLWLLANNFVSVYRIDNFPLYSQISLVSFLIQMLGLLFIVYWGYKQTKIPTGEQAFSFYLKTLGLYTVCIFFLCINSVVIAKPVISKIASFVSTEKKMNDLESEFRKYDQYFECSVDPENPPKDGNINSIQNHLRKYGIIGYSDHLRYASVHYGEIYCDKNRLTLIAVYDYRSSFNPADVINQRVQNLKYAKNVKEGKIRDSNPYSKLFDWWYYLKASFFLGLLVLISTYPNYAIRRDWIPAFLSTKKFNLKFRFANLIKKLDNHLLIHYPVLWSTKFHTYLIYALFFIFCLFILFLFDNLFFEKELFITSIIEFLENLEGNDIILLLLSGIIFFLISSISWAYPQSKIKFIPIKYYENFYLLLVYFFLLSLVPLMTLFILNFFKVSSQNNELHFILMIFFPYLSIPFVTWVYSSKFMTNRQSLFYNLSVIGISFGIAVMLLIISENQAEDLFGIIIILLTLTPLFLIYFFLKRNKAKLVCFFSVLYMTGLSLSSFFIVITFDNNLLESITGMKNYFASLLYLIGNILVFILLFTPAVLALLKIKSIPQDA